MQKPFSYATGTIEDFIERTTVYRSEWVDMGAPRELRKVFDDVGTAVRDSPAYRAAVRREWERIARGE